MALYPLLRPLTFALDAERAHRLTVAAVKLLPAGAPPVPDPVLATTIAGLPFPNPIGLAAGFDKNAELFAQMLGFGFGFVEVGTVTPQPQTGNARPRLFRLAEDRAVINRLGFNNLGVEAAAKRLAKRWRRGNLVGAVQQLDAKLAGRRSLIGVNVGANRDSADRIADYAAAVRAMAPYANYLTVNVSSPNTPGLRALQDAGALEALLDAVREARGRIGPPLFLKVAPDLEPADVDAIARVAAGRIDALIVGNTTVSRPPLRSRFAGEAGGLSGAPLKALALERLRDFRRATGGALPLIAVGGIASGADAYERIRAGASLVQLYTALIYGGPGLPKRIARELKALLLRDGFAKLDEAVGSAAA
jgi:dihydroorotate dehydrogenase